MSDLEPPARAADAISSLVALSRAAGKDARTLTRVRAVEARWAAFGDPAHTRATCFEFACECCRIRDCAAELRAALAPPKTKEAHRGSARDR